MIDLIVVGNEYLDIELYMETIYVQLLDACLEYSIHLNEIYEKGIRESTIKEVLTEHFSPIFSFFAYGVQGNNNYRQATLIRGRMEEFIENIDTYDSILF